MIPLSTNKRILELYSGRRNRNIYPNPSSFETPFAPTVHQSHCMDKSIIDPICKGQIYYTIDWTPENYDTINWSAFASGSFAVGSIESSPILKFTLSSPGEKILNTSNYFNGFIIYKLDSGQLSEQRLVRSYDPSNRTITLNRPFETPIIINNNSNGFALFSGLPETWSIYIPTIDYYDMVVNSTPLYYNGYYVVFESPNPNYSNSTNSNIFSRRISYYDSETQLAYFDEPLPFDYYENVPTTNQIWTLRKSLPLERWTLNKTTYYNTTKSVNPIIGPLPGYVVILPDEASSIDNYYKGKYIYVVSNPALTYSPPLPSDTLPIKGLFYPIYGLFYIAAYNGTTKELSIRSIINNNKYVEYNKSDIPTCKILDTSSLNFSAIYGATLTSFIESTNINYIVSYTVESIQDDNTALGICRINNINNINIKPGKKYKIIYEVKAISDYINYFQPVLYDSYNYNNLTDYFQTFTIEINTLNNYIDFSFTSYEINFEEYLELIQFQIVFLEIYECDIINIVEFDYENYSPLDYNGTMVSTEQVVCYDMSIQSVTLPNTQLLTGSSIAFYPYVYVQIENLTSPNRVSPNTIISNNPPSTKAVFTLYVPQVNNADIQKFVTLYAKSKQIVKFKPNDNLKFSIYLSDGTPFQTLLPDTFSPYPPDPSIQIHAVFNLTRIIE